jgi:hypothetical protein
MQTLKFKDCWTSAGRDERKVFEACQGLRGVIRMLWDIQVSYDGIIEKTSLLIPEDAVPRDVLRVSLSSLPQTLIHRRTAMEDVTRPLSSAESPKLLLRDILDAMIGK